ncbi:MAG: NERD domain-containing protein [Candidatus Poseidoniales archaeon]|nr:MAG: NERD domain-containing protein [Candidatus Poseidoniales archaeon]
MNSFGETMKLIQRWSWWRQRRRFHPPDEIHRAGELAEQRLAKISRAAGKKNGWHVFESVRIPDAEQGGKREIDLVIVGGNTMLVVEQKHWSGTFEINAEEEFIQHRKNGTTHNHSTVNQRIARKSRMLNAMHNERIGKDDGVDVRVVLAFTNRNLDWPKSVNQLSSEVYDEAGFISVLEDGDPGELNEELLTTVAGFGTWDEVQLNGGLMCKGDVLGLGLGDDVEAWQSARSTPLTAQISHKSGFASMFSSQPSSMELGHGTLRLSASLPYGATMKMHVVGKKAPEEILWSTIEAINLSKPVAYPELGQE